MLIKIREFFSGIITGHGSQLAVSIILILITVIAAALCYWITKKLLVLLERLILRSPTKWDDHLLNNRFLKAVSQLAPAICVRWMLPGFFGKTPETLHWLSSITSLYIVGALVLMTTVMIDNLYNAFTRRKKMKAYAIKGVFQMVKLVVIGIGAIIGISIIINKSPLVIITALGASAAILMLVFKDTILGLVASIQLTANNMLRKGDWIVMEKHDANGEVIDVSLTTIKVRNWDNSVTTIPPYALVSESFRNYEPMRVSGCRRVDRAIFIDANTVRFLTSDEMDSLHSEGWLDGIDLQGDRIVNLGLLRNYLEQYLRNNPLVSTGSTLMVRQLEPTNSGLPLQLYFFTNVTEWVAFEKIQSDIFDHVYSTVRRFHLSMFQTPAGTDIARAK